MASSLQLSCMSSVFFIRIYLSICLSVYILLSAISSLHLWVNSWSLIHTILCYQTTALFFNKHALECGIGQYVRTSAITIY